MIATIRHGTATVLRKATSLCLIYERYRCFRHTHVDISKIDIMLRIMAFWQNGEAFGNENTLLLYALEWWLNKMASTRFIFDSLCYAYRDDIIPVPHIRYLTGRGLQNLRRRHINSMNMTVLFITCLISNFLVHTSGYDEGYRWIRSITFLLIIFTGEPHCTGLENWWLPTRYASFTLLRHDWYATLWYQYYIYFRYDIK